VQVAPRQVEIGAHLVGRRAGRKEEKNPKRHPRGPRVSSQGSAHDAKRLRIVKRSGGATEPIEADAYQKKQKKNVGPCYDAALVQVACFLLVALAGVGQG